MIDATVCIPWRSAPDRLAAHDRVRRFWKHHGFRVVEADSSRRLPFSVSEARNNAVRMAKTTTVIVADADTIPDIGAVFDSIDTDGVTYPFTYYRHIPADWVDRSDLLAAPIDQEYRNSLGGLLICRRELYWHLGGFDERFSRCWGYEDNAFALVAKTLATVHRRPGVIFSFNHAAERDLTPANPNQARYRLYQHVATRPALLPELLKR